MEHVGRADDSVILEFAVPSYLGFRMADHQDSDARKFHHGRTAWWMSDAEIVVPRWRRSPYSALGTSVPFIQVDELLCAIIDRLVDNVLARGNLALNRWQVFCLITWWYGSGHPREPAFEGPNPLAPDDARRLFERCIYIAQYTYHPATDSFTIEGQAPAPWAPPPPAALVAPGGGILYHVARSRRSYRTRMIHVDLRTQNAVDDVKRGIGDVVYCCADSQRRETLDVITVSAPAPGLLDGLPLADLETLVRQHGGSHVPPVAHHGAPARVRIRFDGTTRVSDALLGDLVRSTTPATGIVLATFRRRREDRNLGNYEWDRRAGDFAPVQVARAIIRARHLGSLFESYRTGIHEQIDNWRTSSTNHHTGEADHSGSPGMAAYDLHLYRVAIRVHVGREVHGLIRAGFAAKLSEAMAHKLCDIETGLGARLGGLISSLRRWFRGTVARAHLCWDIERSLLIRIADHLAGTSRFLVAEFQSSVALLHSMLADVEVDERDTEGTPAELVGQLGAILQDMHGMLAAAVVVVPWLFRRGYRVIDRRQPPSDGRYRSISGEEVIPQPAIYVAQHYEAFRPVGERDDRRGEDSSGLASAASSRDYLVALQSMLSSLLASRPNITLLRWRGSSSTVDLLDQHGPVETVTLDLPAGEHRFEWIEIIQDSPDCMITLHHDYQRPFYHPDPWSGWAAPRSNAPLRYVLERGQALNAGDDFHAIAVVWRRAELTIPLAIALPEDGKPLRKHLVDTRDRLLGFVVTNVPHLNASFSFTYAPSILRHGWYQPEALGQLLRGKEAADDFRASDVAAGDADAQFVAEYLHSSFRPAGSDPFPAGLKPFGRQLHVFPVAAKDGEPQLLSIVTNWELEHGELPAQRTGLHEHVTSVVAKHGGQVGPGNAPVEYVKYENGKVERVDTGEYSANTLADKYEVVVLQRAARRSAELSTQCGKTRETLTDGLLRILIKFVMSPNGATIRGARVGERQFLSLRKCLERLDNTVNGKPVDSPYWKVSRPPGSAYVYRFRAPSYLIVVPSETVQDL